ncbi:MAG TPA: hypothetical protein VHT05_05525 [Candidatus Elarobacter sp.]|jgi:hypothetical protein|nr:hypothetical protein [Candidatus Elarobacter sp.]
MVRPIIALLGTAGVLAAAPAGAAPAPVGILACAYTSSQLTNAETGFARTPPLTISNLHLAFVDHAPSAATDVRVTARYARVSQTLDLRGRFTSGVEIARDVAPLETGTYEDAPARCTVDAVTFADGSTWRLTPQ